MARYAHRSYHRAWLILSLGELVFQVIVFCHSHSRKFTYGIAILKNYWLNQNKYSFNSFNSWSFSNVFSVFLFQGCCLGEADGVAEGFYLWAGSQGKVCRHNIRDRVPTWKKGFSGFCYIPIILFKYYSHNYPPPKSPINTPDSEKYTSIQFIFYIFFTIS